MARKGSTTVGITPEEVQIIRDFIRRHPHRWPGKSGLASFVHEAIREKFRQLDEEE